MPRLRPAWVTRGYALWLGAGVVSSLGSGVIAFALTWTATGLGGTLAGVLSAAGLAPTIVLMLVGGSLGDRLGQRQLLLVSTIVQIAQYLVFWILLKAGTALPALLLGNAVFAGVLQGLRGPSTNVFARQFVDPADSKAAISVSSTTTTLVRMVSPSLGAIILAVAGLSASLLIQAASFLGVLFVLVLVRPEHEPTRPSRTGGMGGHILDGLRSVAHHRQASALLAATALVAGALLPLTSLGFPLLSRSRRWGVGTAGLLEGVWLAGTILVSLVITTRYARNPSAPPRGIVSGPLVAAVGIVALALVPSRTAGIAAALVIGIGTSLFTANVGPMLVALTPAEYLSRWAAITGLAQYLPALVAGPAVGLAADRVGMLSTLFALAAIGALAAVLGARVGRVQPQVVRHS